MNQAGQNTWEKLGIWKWPSLPLLMKFQSNKRPSATRQDRHHFWFTEHAAALDCGGITSISHKNVCRPGVDLIHTKPSLTDFSERIPTAALERSHSAAKIKQTSYATVKNQCCIIIATSCAPPRRNRSKNRPHESRRPFSPTAVRPADPPPNCVASSCAVADMLSYKILVHRTSLYSLCGVLWQESTSFRTEAPYAYVHEIPHQTICCSNPRCGAAVCMG